MLFQPCQLLANAQTLQGYYNLAGCSSTAKSGTISGCKLSSQARKQDGFKLFSLFSLLKIRIRL